MPRRMTARITGADSAEPRFFRPNDVRVTANNARGTTFDVSLTAGTMNEAGTSAMVAARPGRLRCWAAPGPGRGHARVGSGSRQGRARPRPPGPRQDHARPTPGLRQDHARAGTSIAQWNPSNRHPNESALTSWRPGSSYVAKKFSIRTEDQEGVRTPVVEECTKSCIDKNSFRCLYKHVWEACAKDGAVA